MEVKDVEQVTDQKELISEGVGSSTIFEQRFSFCGQTDLQQPETNPSIGIDIALSPHMSWSKIIQ